jgi:hypothetical protein
MKVLKKVLSYLGTLALMAFHGYIILKDGRFDIPVAGQFVLLHFIWFEICERRIEKALASIR